jgi:hypothetical protein
MAARWTLLLFVVPRLNAGFRKMHGHTKLDIKLASLVNKNVPERCQNT